MGLIEKKDYMDYWNVSQGALRKKCEEGDEGAEKREYTTKQGEKRVIYEIVKEGISGYIRNVELRDGDFGEQLMVYIDDVESFALQMSWDSSEAMSFAERLKAIDLSKMVEIRPYCFVPKGKKKSKRGVTVYQDGKKIDNYFLVRDDDGAVIDFKDGFPQADGDTEAYDSDDWKMFFIKQKKFLRKNVIDEFPFVEGAVEGAKEKPKSDLPFDL